DGARARGAPGRRGAGLCGTGDGPPDEQCHGARRGPADVGRPRPRGEGLPCGVRRGWPRGAGGVPQLRSLGLVRGPRHHLRGQPAARPGPGQGTEEPRHEPLRGLSVMSGPLQRAHRPWFRSAWAGAALGALTGFLVGWGLYAALTPVLEASEGLVRELQGLVWNLVPLLTVGGGALGYVLLR